MFSGYGSGCGVLFQNIFNFWIRGSVAEFFSFKFLLFTYFYICFITKVQTLNIYWWFVEVPVRLTDDFVACCSWRWSANYISYCTAPKDTVLPYMQWWRSNTRKLQILIKVEEIFGGLLESIFWHPYLTMICSPLATTHLVEDNREFKVWITLWYI